MLNSLKFKIVGPLNFRWTYYPIIAR